jgi:hypothetical protein
MQNYAIALFCGALACALFADNSVTRSVARTGRTGIIIFLALFAVAEGIALMS